MAKSRETHNYQDSQSSAVRYMNLVLTSFELFQSERSTGYRKCYDNLQQFQRPTSSTKPIDGHWLKHYWNRPNEGRTGWIWYQSIATESIELKNKGWYMHLGLTTRYIRVTTDMGFVCMISDVKCCGPRRGVGIPKYIRPFQKALGSLIRYDAEQRSFTSLANVIAN